MCGGFLLGVYSFTMFGSLNERQMEEVLQSQYYGHLACSSEGEIYLVPITYVYDGGTIVSYTHEGKKIDMLRKKAVLCVQVERFTGTHEWQSVICWGDFEEISDAGEKQEAALRIADKFAEARKNGKTLYSPLFADISSIEGKAVPLPVIYRIRVLKKTGRYEKDDGKRV